MSTRLLPGWYPDPTSASRKRYWDGQRWTVLEPPPQPLGTAGLWVTLSIIAVVGVFFAGCTAVMAAGSESQRTASSGSHSGPTAAPGTSVVDGDFEFVVSDVSTPRIGAAIRSPMANGSLRP